MKDERAQCLMSFEEGRCMVLSAVECPALGATLRWSCRGGGGGGSCCACRR
jgi:hypothetical protein